VVQQLAAVVEYQWGSSGSCRGFERLVLLRGEEIAGQASAARRTGGHRQGWSIMDLLAAEITAHTGKDPGEHYRELTAEFGTPY